MPLFTATCRACSYEREFVSKVGEREVLAASYKCENAECAAFGNPLVWKGVELVNFNPNGKYEFKAITSTGEKVPVAHHRAKRSGE